MNYSRRETLESDLPFIRRLHEASMRPHVESQFGTWDEAFQRKKFLESSSIAGHEIIEKDDTPIGCCLVDEGPQEICLDRLWLLPQYQNQGIGTSFVQRLAERADSLKIPIKLRVLRVNPARLLYERLGFNIIDESDTHYVMQRPADA